MRCRRCEFENMPGETTCFRCQAVLLRLVDETPYQAIGDILNCSEATARSHVSKGRLRLREILSGHESP